MQYPRTFRCFLTTDTTGAESGLKQAMQFRLAPSLEELSGALEVSIPQCLEVAA